MKTCTIQHSISSVLLVLASLTSLTDWVSAQSAISPCQPPQPNEYLLLVISQTRESQEQIKQALPRNAPATVCQYLNDTVTRVAGFRQLEDANAWAEYINNSVGLSAFVVRSPSAPSPAPPSYPSSPSYNPQPLGDGYAVLVDYYNQPEIAAQVQQLLGSEVGLASYGQRPYLLAVHTSNAREANSILQELSDRGFWSMVVDSRKVIRLTSSVRVNQPSGGNSQFPN